jgi:WD40 repeat protein
LLITASSQYIFLLSLKTAETVAHLHKAGKNIPVRYIKISSSRLYAAYEDGEITVWDLDTHEFLSSLDLHKSTVSSLAVSEDETRLVSSGLDGSIILWDLLS